MVEKVPITIKTTSVASGQKFENDFLVFELALHDMIGTIRMTLAFRLHEDANNYEECAEYTNMISIKIVTTANQIIGSFTKLDNKLTVAEFLEKYNLADVDWYLQMPMSSNFRGGGGNRRWCGRSIVRPKQPAGGRAPRHTGHDRATGSGDAPHC